MDDASPTRLFPSTGAEWKETPDGVRYQQVLMTPGDPTRPLLVLSELPPGYCEPPHTHESNYVEIVVEGELTVGKVALGKGDMRAMKGGAGYGPLTAGPAGCLRLTVFDRAEGSLLRPLGKAAAD
jgi:anti-sigma factor ChrR (cupin superfamily)